MATVTFMPAVSPKAIIEYFGQEFDLAGWVRKDVTISGPYRAILRIAFENSEPRTFHLVSKSMFSDFGDVKIYEVKP